MKYAFIAIVTLSFCALAGCCEKRRNIASDEWDCGARVSSFCSGKIFARPTPALPPVTRVNVSLSTEEEALKHEILAILPKAGIALERDMCVLVRNPGYPLPGAINFANRTDYLEWLRLVDSIPHTVPQYRRSFSRVSQNYSTIVSFHFAPVCKECEDEIAAVARESAEILFFKDLFCRVSDQYSAQFKRYQELRTQLAIALSDQSRATDPLAAEAAAIRVAQARQNFELEAKAKKIESALDTYYGIRRLDPRSEWQRASSALSLSVTNSGAVALPQVNTQPAYENWRDKQDWIAVPGTNSEIKYVKLIRIERPWLNLSIITRGHWYWLASNPLGQKAIVSDGLGIDVARESGGILPLVPEYLILGAPELEGQVNSSEATIVGTIATVVGECIPYALPFK